VEERQKILLEFFLFYAQSPFLCAVWRRKPFYAAQKRRRKHRAMPILSLCPLGEGVQVLNAVALARSSSLRYFHLLKRRKNVSITLELFDGLLYGKAEGKSTFRLLLVFA